MDWNLLVASATALATIAAVLVQWASGIGSHTRHRQWVDVANASQDEWQLGVARARIGYYTIEMLVGERIRTKQWRLWLLGLLAMGLGLAFQLAMSATAKTPVIVPPDQVVGLLLNPLAYWRMLFDPAIYVAWGSLSADGWVQLLAGYACQITAIVLIARAYILRHVAEEDVRSTIPGQPGDAYAQLPRPSDILARTDR